ncbi:MAG: type II toxin-antitoxin system VapC family toxin [Streptosporangiales bacterium]
MPVVVDAAAAVELVRRTKAGKRAADELRGRAAAAPAHLDAEVLSALARIARDDPDDASLVPQRLRQLARAPITRYPCAPLLEGAWSLRANVAIRDALYVVLAQRLGAELVTADARLARASAQVLGVSVHLV